MTYFLLLFSLFQMTNLGPKQVIKNGMSFEWEFIENNQLKIKLTAPTNGWFAIGINDKDDLEGSNLIMASITKDTSIISDRYIVGLGNHQSMEELGAHSKVKFISSNELEAGSEAEFILATNKNDPYHFQLAPKKQIFLMLAYSQDDDFRHHSTMRTTLKIIL